MTTATLYIDVENLQELAKRAIQSAVENWPQEIPKLDRIQLYVRADQTRLWQIWAEHTFPSLKVTAVGIQRYGQSVKNLADMNMAIDAILDLVGNITNHIVIFSDDSDFVALFAAIKRVSTARGFQRIPFDWLFTNRSDTRSDTLDDFLPPDYLHVIDCSGKISQKKGSQEVANGAQTIHPVEPGIKENELIAISLIKEMPIGLFKSSDSRKFIVRNFPGSDLSKTRDSATFGNHFAKNIWPILQEYGVKLPNPERKPRKYEMTAEAKTKLAN